MFNAEKWLMEQDLYFDEEEGSVIENGKFYGLIRGPIIAEQDTLESCKFPLEATAGDVQMLLNAAGAIYVEDGAGNKEITIYEAPFEDVLEREWKYILEDMQDYYASVEIDEDGNS